MSDGTGFGERVMDMTEQLMSDLEDCLKTIYSTGEWADDHDAILARWREARGETAKGPWRWWASESGDELYANELGTRDEAIAWARKEYGGGVEIEIIEARCWQDSIQGEDNFRFAETRNHEKLPAAVRAA